LVRINIPNSVTSVGQDAFVGCPIGCVIMDPTIARTIGPNYDSSPNLISKPTCPPTGFIII
jgi:hypothetical protein